MQHLYSKVEEVLICFCCSSRLSDLLKPGWSTRSPDDPKIGKKEPDFAILALKPGTSEVIWEFSEDSGSDQPLERNKIRLSRHRR